MPKDKPEVTTLTHRFAAIQIKMWHLQFRMQQVFTNQSILNEQQFSTNRERIRGLGPAIFSVVDMLVALEHIEVLMSDILGTEEIRTALTKAELKSIGRTKNLAARWKSVRKVLSVQCEPVSEIRESAGLRQRSTRAIREGRCF